LDIFSGKYFVLDGLLSMLENKTPENIGIPRLMEKVKSKNITEVILALSATVEAETTIFYISEALKELNLKITRFAGGMPVGGEIEYMDIGTLQLALRKRSEV
jgi:recombination protein RecR